MMTETFGDPRDARARAAIAELAGVRPIPAGARIGRPMEVTTGPATRLAVLASNLILDAVARVNGSITEYERAALKPTAAS